MAMVARKQINFSDAAAAEANFSSFISRVREEHGDELEIEIKVKTRQSTRTAADSSMIRRD